ncbi:hypothetical protein [Micromonospora sp. NPDC005413]|uniref:hypothetical protein n=1 Tax=Micromonospora sp. NPDC005413 TaxID=3154563 RepID=UPI0033AE333D
MNRKLSYTPGAFAKRVRMSKETALFIIVEGRDFDTPFYEGVAKSSDYVNQKGYQVWLIEQITRRVGVAGESKTAGGKAALIAVYDQYKQSNSLSVINSTGRRSIAFCADRDVDEVSKSLRRSRHVIYTPLADAEACAYIYGDFARAIGRAASLDKESAKAFAEQNADWTTEFARLWKDWIELCCLAAAHRAFCHVGTSKLSAVNEGAFGPLIKAEVARAKRVILLKSQVHAAEHAALEQKVKDRLRRIYGAGKARRLLGKHWILAYLLHLLSRQFGEDPVTLTNFKHRAPIAFLDALDFDASWATYYRRKFEALV